MRKSILMLLCAWTCIASPEALAANAWTGYKTVTEIQVIEDGGFLITFSTPIGPQCSQGGPSTLYIYANAHYVTSDGAKAMLSTALTAFATGMKVNVMYDDSTSACYGRYLRIAP